MDIMGRRQARQEAAKSQSSGSQLEGIEYWEMVEIQLAALLSKDKTAKPWRRQEFLEEPDVDPVTLEKVLRRSGHPEFTGYSGQEIDESEIDIVSPENEPMIKVPREILAEFPESERFDMEEDEEEDIALEFTPGIEPEQPRGQGKPEGERGSDQEEDEIEIQEEDPVARAQRREQEALQAREDDIVAQIGILRVRLRELENALPMCNSYTRPRKEQQIADHRTKILLLERDLAELREQ
jgi:hypothetical protein